MARNNFIKQLISAVVFLSICLLPFNTILGQSNGDIKSAIERMSLEEVVDLIQNLKESTTSGVYISLTKRLYEIAYYEHHIPVEKRETAIRLLEVTKNTLKEAFKNNPKALKIYESANQLMENNIPLFGYGSLGWLLEENQIQGKNVINFIMQPKHGHLLSTYLKLIGEDQLKKTKPYLIKDLIILRLQYSKVENAVLRVFGLVTKKDPAAFAVFSSDEIKIILNTPKRYQESRNILVKYGLLPRVSQSKPFYPKPKDKMLISLIMLSSDYREGAGKNNFWKENSEMKTFYNNLNNEVEKPFLEMSLFTQRILLWLDLTKDIFGEEVHKRIKNNIFAQLRKPTDLGLSDWFNAVETAKNSYSSQMTISIDVLTTYRLMVAGGLIKDLNNLSEENKRLLLGYAIILNRDRIESLAEFRFYLRYFASPPSYDFEEIYREILINLMERYVNKGSFSGGIENSLYMEDWIGHDVLN